MKTRVNLDTEDGFNATVMSDDGSELATVYDRKFFEFLVSWLEFSGNYKGGLRLSSQFFLER